MYTNELGGNSCSSFEKHSSDWVHNHFNIFSLSLSSILDEVACALRLSRKSLPLDLGDSHSAVCAPRRSNESGTFRTGSLRWRSQKVAPSRRGEETTNSVSEAKVCAVGSGPEGVLRWSVLSKRRYTPRRCRYPERSACGHCTSFDGSCATRRPPHQKLSSTTIRTTLFNSATIPALDNDLNLTYSIHIEKTVTSPLSEFF